MSTRVHSVLSVTPRRAYQAGQAPLPPRAPRSGSGTLCRRRRQAQECLAVTAWRRWAPSFGAAAVQVPLAAPWAASWSPAWAQQARRHLVTARTARHAQKACEQRQSSSCKGAGVCQRRGCGANSCSGLSQQASSVCCWRWMRTARTAGTGCTGRAWEGLCALTSGRAVANAALTTHSGDS